jgi:predicted Rossmann fold nucleotide-binding protein DprA/Smf involved in DNA uptake
MLRNRIITGMSHVVVPCEAGPNSRGTLGAVGFAVAQGRMIVVGRVKPSWRHYESAWLAERLATGSQLMVKEWRWSTEAQQRVARMDGAIANGVGDDRESIAELVEFALKWNGSGQSES